MADLREVAALHADERVWRHRPEGKHPSIEYSRDKVLQMVQQWASDGLGYWSVRLRTPVADLAAGEFIGVGGCALDTTHGWWNLYYRLRPESHGHRLATELSSAALIAAHGCDPDRAVVASLAAENHASRVTAERAGLRLQWQGPDDDHPGAVRLVYADRPVDVAQASS
ncbi:N-acetyltransferase [Flexivirga caeni]|uniref:N-acetyltransferase n=2 Tax=Flexivirga caeni TaxID=2294115 RepID=A0A3M9LV54_9MICO|nr:N-acetyltransferase [Flexivirga caeni]